MYGAAPGREEATVQVDPRDEVHEEEQGEGVAGTGGGGRQGDVCERGDGGDAARREPRYSRVELRAVRGADRGQAVVPRDEPRVGAAPGRGAQRGQSQGGDQDRCRSLGQGNGGAVLVPGGNSGQQVPAGSQEKELSPEEEGKVSQAARRLVGWSDYAVMTTPTYYETLDCDVEATPEELKRSYQRKAKQLHPDKDGDSEQFVALDRAWKTLRDAEKRREYDAAMTQCAVAAEGPLLCAVRLSEMSPDGDTWTWVCRCGGCFKLTRQQKDFLPLRLPCDECSFHVLVSPDPT